jgi:dolichol-phosphate mannosyltransferase
MRVLVVLPTFNECENIGEVLHRTRVSLPDADVLVVDDGSPDSTAELAEAVGAELGHVEVLRRPRKAGLGSAYRDGFALGLARGYDVMIEMDSDGSHDPSVLPELVGAIERGADLAIGSRYVDGGSIPDWKPLRRAISRGGCWFARTMLGLSVQDATAGFRAYHSRVLSTIDFGRVRADGYGFQVEMTYLTELRGGRIVEVPICFHDRTRGSSKMSSRIVAEAFALVTWWSVRDHVTRIAHPRRSASLAGVRH